MKRVRRNRSFYERAVGIVTRTEGMSLWYALASLHFREAGFARSYNSFQLDKAASGAEERRRIREHFAKVCRRYEEPVKDADDFGTCCLVAADFLVHISARKKLLVDGRPDREAIADALLRYNAGRNTSKRWQDHAYCASDPKRGVRLKVRGTVVHKGVRKRVDFVDSRPGAVVVYDELRARAGELGSDQSKLGRKT